jgi:hypothetical protein
MNLYKNKIDSDVFINIQSFIEDNHDEGSVYTFHQGRAHALDQLRSIFKEVPEIYNLLNQETYIVTRKANAETSNAAYIAHFDNYDSTILVPIRVPDSDFNGDIVLWEKARRYPSNVFFHLCTKILFQNKLVNWLLMKTYSYNNKFKRYRIKPGQFVIFNGYVDLHFNLHVDKEERISLLIHNNKPFKDSFIVRRIDDYNKYWTSQVNKVRR